MRLSIWARFFLLVVLLVTLPLLAACGDGKDAPSVTAQMTTKPEETLAPTAKPTTAAPGKEWTPGEVLVELQKIGDKTAEVASAWGPWSRPVAQGFFQRSGPAVEDAKKMTTITEVAPRTWFIRMPFANMSVFETDEGIVLVDTGGACHGPALLEAIRSVSDAPIHTAIYTHAHIDHAYGLWAFKEAGEMPKNIIAHENTVEWFKHYIRMRGFEAYHSSNSS